MSTKDGIEELRNAPMAKRKPKNILAGAINIAIQKAERFGTPLVFKSNGKIMKVDPSDMKH